MTEHSPVRINLIGKAGAGKSTVAAFLKDEYGFEVYSPSDVLRNFAKENNLTLKARQDYVDAHLQLHETNPKAMIDPVLNSTHPRLLVDGMRAPGNVKKLQEQVGMKVVALVADDAERHQRAIGRSRDGENSLSLAEFLARESADEHENPYLPNVGKVIGMADVQIDANPSEKEVQKAIEEYLQQLGINKDTK